MSALSGAMASPQPTFQLEWFEFIPTTTVHALVRVGGHWQRDDQGSPAPPHLIAERAGPTQRFAPLDPAEAVIVTGSGPRVWRAAYAVPLEVVEDHGSQFLLETADGARTSLPAPTERER